MAKVQISHQAADEKLHLLPKDALLGRWVSESSRWTDAVWILINPTAGMGIVTINWDVVLPDGSRLTDPQWIGLLDAAKRFIWSLICDRRSGQKAVKVATIRQLQYSLHYFIRWMVSENYHSFDEVDAAACREYLEFIKDDRALDDPEDTENGSGEETDEDGLYEAQDDVAVAGIPGDEVVAQKKVGFSQIRELVLVPVWLYQQSPALAEAGINVMPERPFEGKTVGDVTQGIIKKIIGRIPPVPDQIYIPALNKVVEWLDVPAQDICALQEVIVHAKHSSASRALKAARSFEFSPLVAGGQPWHAPLLPPAENDGKKYSAMVAHQLVDDLGTACCIGVQARV